MSSSVEYKIFSIAVQKAFCENENSFLMGLLGFVSSKTFEILAVSLDFSSEFAEVIFLFLLTERAVVFAASPSLFLGPAIAVYSGILSDLKKYF